tara:strand:- start:54925 stop:55308 length:384 start_codon:yes stop_codon:yes gene_type:complete
VKTRTVEFDELASADLLDLYHYLSNVAPAKTAVAYLDRLYRWNKLAGSTGAKPEVIVSGGNGAGSKRVDLEAETYDAQVSNRNSSRPSLPAAQSTKRRLSDPLPCAPLATQPPKAGNLPHPTNFEAY